MKRIEQQIREMDDKIDAFGFEFDEEQWVKEEEERMLQSTVTGSEA